MWRGISENLPKISWNCERISRVFGYKGIPFIFFGVCYQKIFLYEKFHHLIINFWDYVPVIPHLSCCCIFLAIQLIVKNPGKLENKKFWGYVHDYQTFIMTSSYFTHFLDGPMINLCTHTQHRLLVRPPPTPQMDHPFTPAQSFVHHSASKKTNKHRSD